MGVVLNVLASREVFCLENKAKAKFKYPYKVGFQNPIIKSTLELALVSALERARNENWFAIELIVFERTRSGRLQIPNSYRCHIKAFLFPSILNSSG